MVSFNRNFSKYWNDGGALVNVDELNTANRRLALIGSAALLGTGAGIYWSTLQKLTERASRSRLLKSLKNKTKKITENYAQQDMPVNPDYLSQKTAGSVKSAAPIEIDFWDRFWGRSSKDIRRDAKRSESVLLAPRQGFKTALTGKMAQNPLLYNTLGLIAIPAAFGVGVTASKLLTDNILEHRTPESTSGLSRTQQKAEKRYEAAAKRLREVASSKTASVKHAGKRDILRAALDFVVKNPILSIGTAGGGLYGMHRLNSALANGRVQPNKLSTEWTPWLLGGASLAGLGLGAVTLFED